MNELTLSPFQQRVLLVPEDYDIFLGGGRGGAKSFALLLLALRHIEQYQRKARILYIRRTYKGLADFESMGRDIFGTVYGNAARYNSAEHIWRFPNGGYLELGQLESAADYTKYQGRSFTLLLVDESGQYAVPELLDRLRSNLRGPKNIPVRMAKAANPGDVGHAWLAQRYVFKAKPWSPFYEEKSKRTWVYAPSTFLDNPFIDQEEYKAQLESSCPTDPELLRAWLEGDWAVARGAFFASVLDEKRNAIDPWSHLPDFNRDEQLAHLLPAKRAALADSGWEFYLSHDYGSTAPSVTYVCAKSPGAEAFGRWYPRGSIVLVDELATNQSGQLNVGLGWTIPQLSDAILALAKQWNMKPQGVADDACFSNHGHSSGSIADEFKRCGVQFRRAKKGDRIYGWERMRRMLADAGKPDVPGLYISRNCEYFWATVPYLGRDQKRTQDVDTQGPDHAGDCSRYALLYHQAKLYEKRIFY